MYIYIYINIYIYIKKQISIYVCIYICVCVEGGCKLANTLVYIILPLKFFDGTDSEFTTLIFFVS